MDCDDTNPHKTKNCKACDNQFDPPPADCGFDCAFNHNTCEWESNKDCPSGIYDANGKCLPCEGNLLPKLEIAPQKNSGFNGGTFGPTRRYSDGTPKEHRGADFKNDYGDPIYATHDGWVGKFGKDTDHGGFGTVLVYTDSDGNQVQVLSMHLQDDNRVTGNVKVGDIIGYQGDSGNLKDAISAGLTISHTHVKVKVNGEVVDPFDVLNADLDKANKKVINECDK